MNAMMALFIKLKNKNVYISNNNNDKTKQNSKNQPNFDEYEQQ